ncbi:MAG: ABC transporter permease [Thermoplasmatota archaeon]
MNPKRVWTVFLANWKTLYRDKGGLFFTFLFPIMLMLLFGFIFLDSGSETYIIHLDDNDETPFSQDLVVYLDSMNNTDLRVVDSGDDPKGYMDRHQINFLVVIPDGFGSDLVNRSAGDLNSSADVVIYSDPSISSTQVKYSLVNGLVQAMNKNLGNVTDSIILNDRSIIAEDFTYIEFFIPGVIGLTVMTGAVFGTIFGEMELKQKGVFRKLSTTPISRAEWMMSTMLFQLFLAVLAVVLILFVGWLVFGALLHINFMLGVIIVLEAFFFTGLALILTRFIHEAQAASAVGNVITFPMMFLAGTFFPVENMPPFIQVIAKVLPLYYVNEGLRESMIFNDIEAAFMNTILIGVLAILIFVAGMLFTSWKQD